MSARCRSLGNLGCRKADLIFAAAVITMLPSPRELEDVALSADGVRANLAGGSLFMATEEASGR